MNASDLLSMDMWDLSGLREKRKKADYAARQAQQAELVSQFQSQVGSLQSSRPQVSQTGAAGQSSEYVPYERIPGETYLNAMYICGRGDMQRIFADYTADSTPEDPIAHVRGIADSGTFDFTCHIHDIDPTNASFAEMLALFGHLQKNGKYDVTHGSSNGYVTPTGMMEGIDAAQKHNYIRLIQEHSTSWHFSPSIHTNARDLLRMYTDFMQERKAAQTSPAESGGAEAVPELTAGQAAKALAGKYDPRNMSQEEYSDFVEELCRSGVFSPEDKDRLSCWESGSLKLTPLENAGPMISMVEADFWDSCQFDFSFSSCNGDVLEWAKYRAAFQQLQAETGKFEKTASAKLFEKMAEILMQM